MRDISWFALASTVVAALAIAIGTMIPAMAMGRAISQALEALARQPEAERSITRALFIGLAMMCTHRYSPRNSPKTASRVAFCSSAYGCSGEGGIISLAIEPAGEGRLSGPLVTEDGGISIALYKNHEELQRLWNHAHAGRNDACRVSSDALYSGS